MGIWLVTDRDRDTYTTVAAATVEEAVTAYVADNMPDLHVEEWDAAADPDAVKVTVERWRDQVANGRTTDGYDEWAARQLAIAWEGV